MNATRNHSSMTRYAMRVHGGLRHGGLAPATAPRMPVMTEDVYSKVEAEICDSSTAKGRNTGKNNCC